MTAEHPLTNGGPFVRIETMGNVQGRVNISSFPNSNRLSQPLYYWQNYQGERYVVCILLSATGNSCRFEGITRYAGDMRKKAEARRGTVYASFWLFDLSPAASCTGLQSRPGGSPYGPSDSKAVELIS